MSSVSLNHFDRPIGGTTCDAASELHQDRRTTHHCAGYLLLVQAKEGATSKEVPEVRICRDGVLVDCVRPAPIPGVPGWVRRCDALFHARRRAYALAALAGGGVPC